MKDKLEIQVFAGTISCKAVLENNRREKIRLLVNPAKRSKDISYCISLAKKQNIPVVYADRNQLDAKEKNAGGIILEAKSAPFQSLDNFQNPQGLILYLDGVEDPYNIGSAARSAYAAGAQALIIRKRNWESALTVLMRASAGAWERLQIYQIEDDDQLTAFCKEHSLALVSAFRGDGAISAFRFEWPQNLVLAIGGALRGLGASVLKASSDYVYLPYGREYRNALDTPAAAAVLSFLYLEYREKITAGLEI